MFINQSVKLISKTVPVDDSLTSEGLIAYCARVSSSNQDNPDYFKLLRYCLDNGHVSVFEMADMTVEIVTTLAIATQMLRHRSFVFQQFSQRYAQSTEFILSKARRQDDKNRQNSIDDLNQNSKNNWHIQQRQSCIDSLEQYRHFLKHGVAKEVARMILPQCTATKLYMKGNVRSWIHYLQARTDSSTQLEHRQVAEMIKTIFIEQFPIIGGLLNEAV